MINQLFELFMTERGAFLVVFTGLIVLTIGNVFYAIFKSLERENKSK